jgi:hypothetical protein
LAQSAPAVSASAGRGPVRSPDWRAEGEWCLRLEYDDRRGRFLRRTWRSPEEAQPPPPSNLEWKLSKKGNPCVVVGDTFHVVLFRRGSWAFRIEDLKMGQAWFSERRYQTEEAARADFPCSQSNNLGRKRRLGSRDPIHIEKALTPHD